RQCLQLCLLCLTAPATPETHTLSLHDALPISPTPRPERAPRTRPPRRSAGCGVRLRPARACRDRRPPPRRDIAFAPPRCGRPRRSEEHTSELQSRENLVCRLLLEKKNKKCQSK